MTISIAKIQNWFGKFFIFIGDQLSKAPIRIAAIFVSTGLSIIHIDLFALNFKEIALLILLIILLILVFYISYKIIGYLFICIGNWLISLSTEARFKAEVIDLSVNSSIDKIFAIKFTNLEWFADCENVSCNIGLVGHIGDFEDRLITKVFEDSNRNYNGFTGFGAAIFYDNDHILINIPHKSNKKINFVSTNYFENKLVLKIIDLGNDEQKQLEYSPGKFIFQFVFSGSIKEGKFNCSFPIEVVYKGYDNLTIKVKNEFLFSKVSKLLII